MVEIGLVNRSKGIGIATISLRCELDSRVGTVTKVKGGALFGSSRRVTVVLCDRC